MKCMSCEANIPSDWQAAISANICPKCGNQIMGEEVKTASDALKTTINDLILLGQETMDLVLDSFGLCRKELIPQIKITSPEQENLPPGLKIAPNKVQEFLSRTKAPHLANRQEQMKHVLSRIQAAETEESDENDLVNQYEDEVEEYIRGKEGVKNTSSIKYALENNSLTTGEGVPLGSEEEYLLNVAMGNVDQDDYDPNIHPALQKERMERLAKSRQVASGIKAGSFSRSD
jgi:hypothetical protein